MSQLTIATGMKNQTLIEGLLSKVKSHGDGFCTGTIASTDAEGKTTRLPWVANAPYANILKNHGNDARVTLRATLRWNVWGEETDRKFTLQLRVIDVEGGAA